ncbi:permease [Anoxybacter fermentans]|uniref:Permease n=2 Tax=Anoxybacter fermentans TaxID=1323375 RepID=A0A3S9T2Y8_9FIRM|nr:permease [Anoxybacter fermentans]
MLQPVLFCIMGFTVMFMSSLLYELTDMIIIKKVPVLTVIKILLYRLPAILVMAFPISALFATIYSLGRLAKDNEITIMRISGYGIHRIIIPFLLLGLGLSVGSFWINEKVVPWANHRSMNLVRQIYLKDVTPSIKENIFFKGPENRYFYVRKVDRKKEVLYDVMIYEPQFSGKEGSFPRVITAKKGVFHEDVWELKDGVIHEFDDEGFIVREGQFSQMSIPVSDGLEHFYGNQKTTSEMSRSELEEEIKLFLKSGIKVDSWQVDYHLKLALPFASLIFVLVGVPLSLRNRKGWGMGVVFTLVVVFAYYVIQSLFRSFGSNGLLPPFWAAWLPNIIFAVLGIILLLREEFFILR